MLKVKPLIMIISLIVFPAFLGGCGSTNPPSTPTVSTPSKSTSTTANSMQQLQGATGTGLNTEKPVAPEKNPAGDIPDTQAFVSYVSSQDGYKLDVPEGWARTTKDQDVSFQDKLDGVQVTISKESAPPTVDSVNKNQVAELKKTGRAVSVKTVKSVSLPGGSVVLINYDSNSAPDPVTGKQVRQENSSYLFYKNGKLATLTLWAPLGADNVDQWNRMANSFKWR